ncbi:MAG: hypothetical protein IJK27_01065 [Bacilli bacterium]|nr:hypothetical protein [Bacilli bacterium]
MKSLKLILGLALGTTGLGSTIAFGVANNVVQQNSVAPAEAAGSIPSGVYVDISACQWAAWGATLDNIKAYYWGGSSSPTWPGTKVSQISVNGTTYGYIALPSDAKNIAFNAWDGKDNGYDADKNKTVDLTIPTDGTCLFKITTYNTNSKQNGSWANLEQRYTGTTTPSAKTGRLFTNNDQAHTDWKDGVNLAVRAWGGSASKANNIINSFVSASTYMVTWVDGGAEDGKWYAYADVPTDITGFQFVRMSGSTATADVWSYSDAFELSSDSFSTVYFLKATSTDYCPVERNKANSVGPGLATNLFAAYDTCSSSSYNGYGAYNSLNTNFFAQLTAEANSTQCTSLNGAANYTVAQHVAGMARRPASLLGSNIINGLDKAANPILLTTVIGISGISIIGIFFFVKKRKQQ